MDDIHDMPEFVDLDVDDDGAFAIPADRVRAIPLF
jgi:hypothetical protein